MSSAPPTELTPEAMGAALTRWLNRRVTAVERIGGGRNSRIYKVTAEGAAAFALKMYFRHAADTRDRLATEFNSFSFLWQHGFREIPQPILADPARGWAVYEFIEGEKIPPGRAGEADVKAVADLLGRLRELSRKPDSRQLAAASEAFFAVDQVVANVCERRERLMAVADAAPSQGRGAPCSALREFLDAELTPLLEQVTAWSRERLASAGESAERELPWEQRTLSPSDCGFHNALRRRDGSLIFLDFEYFGWDDPAKMISDFLLHPAMELSAELKKQFASAVLRRFADFPALAGRLEGVYPLFGLKWCLILLNEFLSDSLQRRQFAAVAAADRAALQMQQLEKARRMLQRIRGEYEQFPYRD
jgi:hypothetical protein